MRARGAASSIIVSTSSNGIRKGLVPFTALLAKCNDMIDGMPNNIGVSIASPNILGPRFLIK